MPKTIIANWEDLPIVLDAKDLQRILPIGHNGSYALLNDPGFPSLRIGKKLMVSRTALKAWIECQSQRKEA